MNKIIRAICEDGLELQGFVAHPQGARVGVLHIHGSCGNFYENVFLDHMAVAYASRRISFLSLNTRGHDYYADLKFVSEGQVTWRTGGGVFDVFSECTMDIAAGVEVLRGLGCKEVVLQGHSLGASKVGFSAPLVGVQRVVVLSPADMEANQRRRVGPRYDELMQLASAMVKEGKQRDLMPDDAYEHRISAEGYLSLFSVGSSANVFGFESGGSLETIRRRSIRVFAAIGQTDEYLQVPVEQVDSWLHNELPDSEVLILPNTGHGFQGAEAKVADAAAEWVSRG